MPAGMQACAGLRLVLKEEQVMGDVVKDSPALSVPKDNGRERHFYYLFSNVLVELVDFFKSLNFLKSDSCI